MYFKGALLLNTIRFVVNDDQKWWKLLLDYSNHFKHQIIENKDVIDFFNAQSGINLTPIFNQYLKYKDIPTIEIRKSKNRLEFRWKTDVSDFEMPIDIKNKDQQIRVVPTNSWKKSKFKISDLSDIEVLTNRFLVNVSKL